MVFLFVNGYMRIVPSLIPWYTQDILKKGKLMSGKFKHEFNNKIF
jgi:hypothetical protein